MYKRIKFLFHVIEIFAEIIALKYSLNGTQQTFG